MEKWYDNGYVSFDTETTGVQEKNDRIVSASILFYGNFHEMISQREWLINPGIDIPESATVINGLSTSYARTHGIDAAEGIMQILDVLAGYVRRGVPILAFNGSFDMTILFHEAHRHGLEATEEFAELFGPGSPLALIDGLTMHRKAHVKWAGRRNLGALCQAYGVTLTDAHNATADAQAAAQLCVQLTRETPELFEVPASVLHREQMGWYSEQMEELQAYLRVSRNDPSIICRPDWPVRR